MFGRLTLVFRRNISINSIIITMPSTILINFNMVHFNF